MPCQAAVSWVASPSKNSVTAGESPAEGSIILIIVQDQDVNGFVGQFEEEKGGNRDKDKKGPVRKKAKNQAKRFCHLMMKIDNQTCIQCMLPSVYTALLLMKKQIIILLHRRDNLLAIPRLETDDSTLVLAQQPPKMGETIGLQEHCCLCRVG